jgi:GNAT superfamily N-acetyltransferase
MICPPRSSPLSEWTLHNPSRDVESLIGIDMTGSSELDRLVFHEVEQSRWADFERLFESRGSPKYCWCMVWRATAEEARHTDGVSRKAAMAKRISAGVPVGLLGYMDGEPVAWCSIAPRSTFRRLVDDGSSDEGIWSITCFFVVRRLRYQGIAQRLIKAAIEVARSHGASIVEAYPVDTDSHSYRFMGFKPVFDKAGFSEIGQAGSRRHIMQLRVKE